jgi:hypothetical protein
MDNVPGRNVCDFSPCKCGQRNEHAPWYARNSDIHRDLGIRMVTAEIKRPDKKHEDRLHQHTNAEAIQLLDNERTVRRLKRLKPLELV